LKERDHFKDLGVHRKIILKRNLKGIGRECVEWIHLAQEEDQCWALVNTIMSITAP
jgi:hypothetical protein